MDASRRTIGEQPRPCKVVAFHMHASKRAQGVLVGFDSKAARIITERTDLFIANLARGRLFAEIACHAVAEDQLRRFSLQEELT